MGSGRARRATSWQIIDLPWDLEVQYDIDPPGDEAEEPEIRLSFGIPEFLQMAMTPDVVEEMIFLLQRALKKATDPHAGEQSTRNPGSGGDSMRPIGSNQPSEVRHAR